MILIVSYESDPHVKVVLQKLKEKGHEGSIIDYSLYPKNWQCSLTLNKENQRFSNLELISTQINKHKKWKEAQDVGRKKARCAGNGKERKLRKPSAEEKFRPANSKST